MHRQLLTMDIMLQFMDPSLYKHLQNTESFNLFFCFRWLLVWFKREFSWDDVLSLWDVLFTDHLSTQFHLFVALAILDQHRNVIMDHLKHFDEILKVIERKDMPRADLLISLPLLLSVHKWFSFNDSTGRNTATRRNIIPSVSTAARSCGQQTKWTQERD